MDSKTEITLEKPESAPEIQPPAVDRYLVEGNLPIALWRFAIPFMFAYFLQALYGAVDLFIVGRYCNPAAISAVATGSQLLMVLTGLIFGLAAGATALIGFNIGAKDDEGTARALGSCASIFIIGAAVFTPLVMLSTNWFVSSLQTPTEAVEGTREYVFTIACGLPFLIGYNVVGAIYRGLGDSMTPTIFIAVTCVANVFGDLFLVGYCGMGPLGAAIATDAALAISFIWSLVHMRKKRFPFDFHRTHFRLDKNSVRKILVVGVPLALQDGFTSFSFLIIVGIINSMGVMASGGMGVADRVIGFMFLPDIAFMIAVTTAAAQNFGAKQPRRAFMSFVWGTTFAGLFGLLFWSLCQIWPTEISTLFTNNEEVARQSGLYLRSFSLDCLCVAFIFNINGYFCGLGKSMIVFVHSTITAFLARIPISYLISRGEDATLYDVGWAAPLASCLSIMICIGYFFWLRRGARKNALESGEEQEEATAPSGS